MRMIVMIAMCFCCALSPDIASAQTVLVSKESVDIPVKFMLRQGESREGSALVSWDNAGFNGVFVVRTAVSGTGGVLGHRPDELDMKILSVISREKMESVEDYAGWLAANFKYQKHEDRDDWISPDEILNNRQGDCKDFALLNSAFLRVFNYKPMIYAMARIADSHAICVFEKNGRYLWFDNNKLKVTPAASVEEFKRYISRHYRMYFLYEVDISAVTDN